eukprot:6490692-Amphidinium_carterae.2
MSTVANSHAKMIRGGISGATKANAPHFAAKSSPSHRRDAREAGSIKDRANEAGNEFPLDAKRSTWETHDAVQPGISFSNALEHDLPSVSMSNFNPKKSESIGNGHLKVALPKTLRLSTHSNGTLGDVELNMPTVHKVGGSARSKTKVGRTSSHNGDVIHVYRHLNTIVSDSFNGLTSSDAPKNAHEHTERVSLRKTTSGRDSGSQPTFSDQQTLVATKVGKKGNTNFMWNANLSSNVNESFIG